jgi:hypothetical protein
MLSRQLRTSWAVRPPAQPAGAQALAARDVIDVATKGATPRNDIDEA